jgi:predicted dehydrogenase
VADFHLPAWQRIEEVEIVAAYNRTQAKAEQRAEQYHIPAVYADYRAMFENEDLDFVDIATAPAVHLELVTAAAKHGLPVLCQKPVAPTLAELREMIRVCDEAGVLFMVNENCRFQPWFRRMKTLIDEGAIGRPHYANFLNRSRFSLPQPLVGHGQATLFVNMPRLMIYELGVHYLDTLRYLFGEADSVYTQIHRLSPHVKGEDLASLMIRMNGLTAVVDISWALHPTWQYEHKVSWGEYRIESTKGTLYLRLDGLLRLITDTGEKKFQFPLDSGIQSYQAAQQHFIDSLRTGVEPETSGLETLKTMELVFGAYDSAEHNRIYVVGHDIERLD